MDIGFAATWLCQVSPSLCFTDHFNHWSQKMWM